MFRGGWYFTSNFNILDVPLVSDYSSVECNQIILEIKNSYHIRKAIFLFNDNKEFIKKYDGIEMASPSIPIKRGGGAKGKELQISHTTIKRYALLNKPFKGYIFSYHRLL